MTAYHTYTEPKLIELLRFSDQTALGEIYDRYHARLFTYGLQFLKVPAMAEDLVQDVFLKLWEAREKLDVHTSFSGYLRRMTHNHAMDRIKEMKRDTDLRAEIVLTVEVTQFVDSARSIAANEALLEKALNELPPQRRRVFVLCRQHGRSYEQAAAELGISRHTVKEYMSDALRMLRAAIIDRPDSGF